MATAPRQCPHRSGDDPDNRILCRAQGNVPLASDAQALPAPWRSGIITRTAHPSSTRGTGPASSRPEGQLAQFSKVNHLFFL